MFSLMALAWPNADLFKSPPDVLASAAKLWAASLPEIDPVIGRQALVKLCRENKFPPSIAEFRIAAEGITAKIRERINAEESMIRLQVSMLHHGDLNEWYASLGNDDYIRGIVDQIGGPQKLLCAHSDGRITWDWTSFERVMWNNEISQNQQKTIKSKEMPAALPGRR